MKRNSKMTHEICTRRTRRDMVYQICKALNHPSDLIERNSTSSYVFMSVSFIVYMAKLDSSRRNPTWHQPKFFNRNTHQFFSPGCFCRKPGQLWCGSSRPENKTSRQHCNIPQIIQTDFLNNVYITTDIFGLRKGTEDMTKILFIFIHIQLSSLLLFLS